MAELVKIEVTQTRNLKILEPVAGFNMDSKRALTIWKCLLKHFGQSGQPIPEPVLRTIPPAVITKKRTRMVILFIRIKRFSAAGYIDLSFYKFKFQIKQNLLSFCRYTLCQQKRKEKYVDKFNH
jgi:hypothetical protein